MMPIYDNPDFLDPITERAVMISKLPNYIRTIKDISEKQIAKNPNLPSHLRNKAIQIIITSPATSGISIIASFELKPHFLTNHRVKFEEEIFSILLSLKVRLIAFFMDG